MSDRIHMGGLFSEVDTQAIIDKLLQLEIKRVQKVQKEQADLTANVAAWGDIGSATGRLHDALNTLRGYELWNRITTTSSNPSNLTATATTSAIERTYRVTITQLAQAHSVSSLNVGTALTPSHSATDSLTDGTPLLTVGHSFELEGQTITVSDGETLETLKAKINLASLSMPAEQKVRASILDNRLVIARHHTGNTQIQMADVGGGNALQALELWNGSAYGHELVAARNALFTVDNALVERAANTNLKDVIEGVSLNLRDETDSTIQLTIARDAAAVKTAIEDFITQYNTVIQRVKAYDYVAITSGKDDPSTGVLQGDYLTRSMLMRLRQLTTDMKSSHLNATNAAYTYNGRNGVMDSLQDIGVWTQGTSNEVAIIDEDRLDQLLANNPAEVQQLFRGVFVTGTGYTGGVATDMYLYVDRLTSPIDGQILNKTTNLEKEIGKKSTRIETMLSQLDLYEERLWNEFTAMEDSIGSMQKELSWLTSQLGIK